LIEKLNGYYTVELIQDYKEGKFGGHNVWYNEKEIKENCMDKQKVIEAIDKVKKEYKNTSLSYPGKLFVKLEKEVGLE